MKYKGKQYFYETEPKKVIKRTRKPRPKYTGKEFFVEGKRRWTVVSTDINYGVIYYTVSEGPWEYLHTEEDLNRFIKNKYIKEIPPILVDLLEVVQ